MSLFSHVVLSATDVEGAAVTTWDLHTGTQLLAFKGSGSPANCMTQLGPDYLVAGQLHKDVLHFYTWHKEAILQRCFTAEKITALAASPSGQLVAGGGASGTLYIWNTSSGRLLVSHKAHNKALTCVKWTDRGHMLYTSGQDCIVNCWMAMSLLDVSGAAAEGLQPRWSGAQHTLAVTGLAVGAGDCNPRVVSCSLDHTCRVWAGAQGDCLHTILLPAAAHCVALAWAEAALFAGSSNGAVYHARVPTGPAAVQSTAAQDCTVMKGHTRAVTCAALSTDGLSIVTGSLDGSVRVWDCASLQMMRLLQQPCKSPVTNVLVMTRPPYLHVTGARTGDASTSARHQAKPARPLPLGHFNKFPGASATLQAWEDAVVVIDGTQDCTDIGDLSGLAEVCDGPAVPAGGAALGWGGLPAHGALETAEADADAQLRVRELSAELVNWKRNYADLYEQACAAVGSGPG